MRLMRNKTVVQSLSGGRSVVPEWPLVLRMGGSVIPCASKGENSLGEDVVFFDSSIGHSMAVADGVGSWKDLDTDPGEFSREFIDSIRIYLEKEMTRHERKENIENERDPVEALIYADKMQSKRGTACVCLLTLQGESIKAANLGDTGLMVFRYDVPGRVIQHIAQSKSQDQKIHSSEKQYETCFQLGKDGKKNCAVRNNFMKHDAIWNVLFKSNEMQHTWNFPVQIGTDSLTKAKDAEIIRLSVRPGDVIVMGSDGVFDNLFVNDIRMIISEHALLDANFPCCEQNLTDEKKNVNVMQKLADKIAQEARRCSLHPTRSSPYSRLAQKHSLIYTGGKADDIAVVCGIVTCNPKFKRVPR